MTYSDLNQLLLIMLFGGFALVIGLEWLAPAKPIASFRAWAIHFQRNLALWLMNTAILRFTFGSLPLLGALWAEHIGIGLLNLLAIPLWANIIIGVIVIDLFDYIFHRAMHNVRPFWLLHSVHHADPELDVSTNFRAHPLQTMLFTGWKLLVILGFGLSLWTLLIRELLVIPIAQLHHANIRWPETAERALGWLVVTPAMHRLHHSPQPRQTNSNYGELLSCWDRWFGTYRYQGANVTGPYGLNALREQRWHTVWGMLKTPFAARRYKVL